MASETSSPPSFPFKRTDKYYPAPETKYLREHEPVSRVTLFDGSQAWALTKHADIKKALSSPNLSADRRCPGFPEIHSGGKKAKDEHPTFVNLDDPEHEQQRNMLQDAFEPDAVEGYRGMMKDVVEKVLDNMIARHDARQVEKQGNSEMTSPDDSTIDLIEEFAVPVPTQIVYRILGVPEEDVEELSKDSSVRNGTSRTAAEQANDSLDKYMRDLVRKKIEKKSDSMSQGLIGKLVEEQYRSGNLSEDDVVRLAFLVLTAGNAALINSIGLGMLTLFEHPDQLEELKGSLAPSSSSSSSSSMQQQNGNGAKNEDLLKNAVVEMLRWNTTSALNSRRAVKAESGEEYRGQQFRKGDSVVCVVQAGDRDADITSDPESFDIHRKYPFDQLLGFGYGPHRCQAEHFSRVELEVAFGQLFRRLPNIKLGVNVDEMEYTPATQNVGVTKLPVTIS